MLPMTSHLFSSGSYRSMVFPISEPIQPPIEAQYNHQVSQAAGYELLIKMQLLCYLLSFHKIIVLNLFNLLFVLTFSMLFCSDTNDSITHPSSVIACNFLFPSLKV